MIFLHFCFSWDDLRLFLSVFDCFLLKSIIFAVVIKWIKFSELNFLVIVANFCSRIKQRSCVNKEIFVKLTLFLVSP